MGTSQSDGRNPALERSSGKPPGSFDGEHSKAETEQGFEELRTRARSPDTELGRGGRPPGATPRRAMVEEQVPDEGTLRAQSNMPGAGAWRKLGASTREPRGTKKRAGRQSAQLPQQEEDEQRDDRQRWEGGYARRIFMLGIERWLRGLGCAMAKKSAGEEDRRAVGFFFFYQSRAR